MSGRTIGPPLDSQTPEEFYGYVENLYKRPKPQGPESAVDGIKITITARSTMVKTTREPRVVTESEVNKLVEEYGQNQLAIVELLTKRGFAIVNEEGLILNAKPKRQRAGRKPKYTRAEADAHLQSGEREDARADQLLVSRPNPDLHEKGLLQPEVGPEGE